MTGGSLGLFEDYFYGSKTALILDLVTRSWQELPNLNQSLRDHFTCATQNWIITCGGPNPSTWYWFEKLCLKSWRENRNGEEAVEWEKFLIDGRMKIRKPIFIAIDLQTVFLVVGDDRILYDLQSHSVVRKVERIGGVPDRWQAVDNKQFFDKANEMICFLASHETANQF